MAIREVELTVKSIRFEDTCTFFYGHRGNTVGSLFGKIISLRLRKRKCFDDVYKLRNAYGFLITTITLPGK